MECNSVLLVLVLPTTNLESTADENITWVPKAGESPRFDDVPTHIAETASEAHACASTGARMASILMARTVVEATAKAKGITSGRLVSLKVVSCSISGASP